MQTKRAQEIIIEIITGRRSVRKYKRQALDDTTIKILLETACWAPSAHDAQPWRFVPVRENNSKSRLANAMAKKYREDMESDGCSFDEMEAKIKLSLDRLTKAPLLVLACVSMEHMDIYPDIRRQRAEMDMAIQTIGAAIQNLLLTAHSWGLGACWMCAPLFCPEIVGESLGLPKDFLPQALITIGYPEAIPKASPRRNLENIIIWR
ncbi:MAG: nitroreductase family protein [Deltaproteobacteria bacterium]|nr:nitroreductase family protein [Deltaproteobacteria bacterium]